MSPCNLYSDIVAAVNVSFQQPIYMFAEGVGTGTVCVEKVGATTQSISVMVTGRKCVCVWAYDGVCVWGGGA